MTESMSAAVEHAPDTSTTEGFRAMMRGFPTGVAIVTATDSAGQPWGMTCSSMCSVTLEPPTLLLCLRAASPTLAAVRVRGRFSVNLLHEHARATAELFASGNPNRFGRVSWQLDADCAGPHLCDDVHAVADCHIVRPTVPAGDHVVVFGLVSRVTRQPGRWPLVYGHRRYRGWSQTS